MTEPPTPDDTNARIARSIDHALLHPTMTDAEILAGCRLAASLNLGSVCVKPYAIPLVQAALAGTAVAVGTVIGFPHGSNPTPIKVAEADWACRAGAVELDMVVNIGRVLQGDWEYVETDIAAVCQVARDHGALLKVIFETDYVQAPEAKRRLCDICVNVGVDFTKTSTGFGFHKIEGRMDYVGATEADVRLMVAACGGRVAVKASGGIRNRADAIKFLALGCTRLGTSASATILQDAGDDSRSY